MKGSSSKKKAAENSPKAGEAVAEFRASINLLFTARFGTFWSASFLSSIGTWAQQVAEPWLLLSIGASPFLIGLDNFAMNAPVWLLTIAGGVLADVRDRRRVIAFFQSIQMVCPAVIAALLLLHIPIQPYWIIGLSVVVGITDSLSMPSFQSIVPSLVSKGEIARGLALNSTQFNLSRILGPAIAGALMSSVGAFACFVLSAASYVPFIGVALWALPKGALNQKKKDKNESHFMPSGVLEILKQTKLRSALLTVLSTSVLCGPLITFCPILVSNVFGGGANLFSLAIAAFGVGGLLGAIALLFIPARRDRRPMSFLFAMIYAAVLIMAGLAPQFWMIPMLMGVAGFSMATSNTSANALIQSTVDPKRLGQATSLFMLAMRGGLPLGSLLTGLNVELFGVQDALLLNGILAIFAQTLIFLLSRDKSKNSAQGLSV